ncbi:hypothetical protein [Streptomyces sp. NPDC086023]|uniref:hypothetical protein n=1 Tax=Streptomyces sp. NPDC086023 TaxID=3365746 RepID=UPI0037D1B36C
MKIDFCKLNEDLPREVMRAHQVGIHAALDAGELTPEGLRMISDAVGAHLDSLRLAGRW